MNSSAAEWKSLFISSTHLNEGEHGNETDPPVTISWKGSISSEELRKVILDSQNLHPSTRFALIDPMYPSKGFIAVTESLAGHRLNLKILSPIRYSPNSSSSEPSTPSKRRTYVACVSCHRAKTGCEETRPCHRCIRIGKPDQCQDRPHRRLGRPKKSAHEDMEPRDDDDDDHGSSVFENSSHRIPSLMLPSVTSDRS